MAQGAAEMGIEPVKGYQAGAGIHPNNAIAFGGSIPANAPNMEIMALDKMLETAGQLGNEFLLSEVRRWNMRIQRYQVTSSLDCSASVDEWLRHGCVSGTRPSHSFFAHLCFLGCYGLVG